MDFGSINVYGDALKAQDTILLRPFQKYIRNLTKEDIGKKIVRLKHTTFQGGGNTRDFVYDDMPDKNYELVDIEYTQTICAQCKIKEGTQHCGRCNDEYYCSKECQKDHWKEHKKKCEPRDQWHKRCIMKIKHTDSRCGDDEIVLKHRENRIVQHYEGWAVLQEIQEPLPKDIPNLESQAFRYDYNPFSFMRNIKQPMVLKVEAEAEEAVDIQENQHYYKYIRPLTKEDIGKPIQKVKGTYLKSKFYYVRDYMDQDHGYTLLDIDYHDEVPCYNCGALTERYCQKCKETYFCSEECETYMEILHKEFMCFEREHHVKRCTMKILGLPKWGNKEHTLTYNPRYVDQLYESWIDIEDALYREQPPIDWNKILPKSWSDSDEEDDFIPIDGSGIPTNLEPRTDVEETLTSEQPPIDWDGLFIRTFSYEDDWIGTDMNSSNLETRFDVKEDITNISDIDIKNVLSDSDSTTESGIHANANGPNPLVDNPEEEDKDLLDFHIIV